MVYPAAAGGDGHDRNPRAWELVRRVRWAAAEFCPIVNEATAGLMDLFEDDELILDAPALSRALTVMAGVLTGMQTAIKMLDWLDPPVVLGDGRVLPLLPPGTAEPTIPSSTTRAGSTGPHAILSPPRAVDSLDER